MGRNGKLKLERCYGCNGTGTMRCEVRVQDRAAGYDCGQQTTTIVSSVCLYCGGTGWLPRGTRAYNKYQEGQFWCKCPKRRMQGTTYHDVAMELTPGLYVDLARCGVCNKVTTLGPTRYEGDTTAQGWHPGRVAKV